VITVEIKGETIMEVVEKMLMMLNGTQIVQKPEGGTADGPKGKTDAAGKRDA